MSPSSCRASSRQSGWCNSRPYSRSSRRARRCICCPPCCGNCTSRHAAPRARTRCLEPFHSEDRPMQRKRKEDRQSWLYRVYKFGATLHDLSPPAKWPESLRQVVRAQRDLWNACHAAWDTNRQQYEDLMTQGEALTPLREARDVALAGLADVQARITAGRQGSRTRAYAGSVPDQDTLRAARTRLTQAKDTLTLAEIAYRNAIRPQLTALLDALWQRVHDLGQESPLAWYNERQVTDSFRNCVERFLRRQGGPPQPKRPLTSAHLTYHFTGPPLTWEQLLLGKSSMITFFQSSGVSDSSPVKRLPARFQSYRSPDKGLPAETPEETEK